MSISVTALSLILSDDDHSRSLVMLSMISSTSSFPFAGTWSSVYPSAANLFSMSHTLSMLSNAAAPPIRPVSGRDWYIRIAIFLSERGIFDIIAQDFIILHRWSILSSNGEYLFIPLPPSLLAIGTVMICPSNSGQMTPMLNSDLLNPSADSS